MKKHAYFIRFLIAFTIALSVAASAQTEQVTNQLGKGLSNDKIVNGLKEALTIGTKNSTNKASMPDGFYKNPLIKIPFPKEAESMEKTLRSIGMDKEVDRFIRTMNKAAEDASKKAVPIFVNAISKITISDGLKILRGGNTAATDFLKTGTSAQLKTEFMPVVKSSLKKVDITKYWNQLAKSYNKIPMVKKMNPDLDDYVTTRAIDGLFKLIATEEQKIRKDPAAQVSNIIQEVFGGK
jgi:hypothetical protein